MVEMFLQCNLVIVFDVFKRSQNLRAWLCFALEGLQSSCESQNKNKGNFSYLLYSFSCCSVELRDTNTNSVVKAGSTFFLVQKVCMRGVLKLF